MVVRELLVAMRDAKLVQPPNEPSGTLQQIELIVLAAVDVERLQPPQVVGLSFDRDDRVLCIQFAQRSSMISAGLRVVGISIGARPNSVARRSLAWHTEG